MTTSTHERIWRVSLLFGRIEALNEIRGLWLKKDDESFLSLKGRMKLSFIGSFIGLLLGSKHCCKPFSLVISV